MAMLSSPQIPRRVRRASLAVLAGATVVANVVTAEAGPLPAQASCAATAPVSELDVGDPLTGLTVAQGTAPESFNATYVGRLDDGIAVGLDLLIIEAEDSGAIGAAGGIWAGMSGSPVYTADGRLLGAVAYGLAGASRIAGVTPATEMMKLLSGGGAATTAPKVDLTARLERAIVSSGAATAEQVSSGLKRLPVPVAVSGASSSRIRRITRMIRRTIPGIQVYASGRAPARAAALPLEPGGNVAAALSYGDVTIAAVGTVTAVCDGEAVLFGHPLLFNGATRLSAHQASAVFVQPDPIFGPFKVANIGGLAGTVDQDRLAGLHTDTSVLPTTTRVHSEVSSVETGASRTATTRAVLPLFVPSAAYSHVISNLDRVHDRIGDGVVTLRWGASGKRSDGSTWSFRRHEKLADSFDATFFAAFKILIDLETLFNNRFEEITIDNVSARGTVDPRFAEARLIGLEMLGANGRWRAVETRRPLRLVAGSDVFLRAVLRPSRSTRLNRVQLSFAVPRRPGREGVLSVSGGLNFFEEEPGSGASNFAELVAQIDRGPTGDTVRADLRLFGSPRITRHARATAPTAVTGGLSFDVQVVSAAA
jgi:hypothetical protein